MVDATARARLAEGMRHLVSGQITNDEFEDCWLPDSDDAAIYEVFLGGPWMLYSDTHEHHLTGPRRVPRGVRRDIARCVVFLASDLEYEWPRNNFLASLCFNLADRLTRGWLGRRHRRRLEGVADPEVWPFYRRADYERALASSPFRGAP